MLSRDQGMEVPLPNKHGKGNIILTTQSYSVQDVNIDGECDTATNIPVYHPIWLSFALF